MGVRPILAVDAPIAFVSPVPSNPPAWSTIHSTTGNIAEPKSNAKKATYFHLMPLAFFWPLCWRGPG